MILVRKPYFSAISFSKITFFRPLLAIETDFLFGLVAISLLLFDMFCPFHFPFNIFFSLFSCDIFFLFSPKSIGQFYQFQYMYIGTCTLNTRNNRLWWKRAVNIVSKTIQLCSQLRTLSSILFCSRYLPCSVL